LTLGALTRAILPSIPLQILEVRRAAGPDETSSRDRQVMKETAVYAIVRAGAKQQKVAVGDVIEIDKVGTAVGESVTLPVVMVVDGEQVTATGLDKAAVTAEVLGATKGPKIVIQKYKNKTGYKKRQGHRQKYTQVKVTDISL
jgi:large subunit ribosomal protein L21